MNKVAVYTGTRNVYEDMVTAAKSLLVNSNVEKIFFLTEDDTFPIDIPDIIETKNLSHQQFFEEGGPNYSNPYSYMCLLRVAFCYLFPKYDSILSLDIDTICDDSVSDIWDYFDPECYFTAVKELHRTWEGFVYTNAGVTLFNLKKLRNGKADECIDVLNRQKFTWIDQDVLNYLCQGYIGDLPSCFNINDWTKPTIDKRIIHYAGIKQWNHLPLVQKYRQMSWEEVLRRHKLNY